MQLIRTFNNRFTFLLCLIGIHSKYAWVIPLKDKKEIEITNVFQKIVDESNYEPNKIWVDKGSEFYNISMKLFLQNNRIETYSTHNQGKSVVSERFLRALKNKIYKYMTSVSKNVYIDKLEEMVNKYNNTYHSIMTMKTFDVRSSTYSNSSKDINEKDPKFKFADIVRLSKYKNIFVKGYTLNWLEEVILIKDVKNTVPWAYVINDLNGEEIVGAD